MKTKIPFSESHPHLHAKRQEHLKGYSDAAGVIVACLIGAPLLALIGGFILFVVWGM